MIFRPEPKHEFDRFWVELALDYSPHRLFLFGKFGSSTRTVGLVAFDYFRWRRKRKEGFVEVNKLGIRLLLYLGIHRLRVNGD